MTIKPSTMTTGQSRRMASHKVSSPVRRRRLPPQVVDSAWAEAQVRPLADWSRRVQRLRLRLLRTLVRLLLRVARVFSA